MGKWMHVKKTEEDYLKLEPTINEMPELYTVNLETDCDNTCCDAEPTCGAEMAGVDPLDS